jgi:hypothetical protein
MLLNIDTRSRSRIASRNILQLAAILGAILLLLVGLYSVAREAGRLLQLSGGTTAPVQAGETPVRASRARLASSEHPMAFHHRPAREDPSMSAR